MSLAGNGDDDRAADERRRPAVEALWAVAIALLPWLLYRGALGLWWADDDLEMLRYLRAHPRLDYLYVPAVWQSLPGSVLTPLQFLSLHVDLALAGMQPGLFYAHQLVAVGGAAAALFWAFRRWWRRGIAVAASVLFLLGRPVLSVAAMVPARHYLEAIAFGALAVVAFHRAVLRADRRFAWLAAGLGLAAMLCKETAVPLPILLAVLPIATWRDRRRALRPQLVAWAVYVVVRVVMLGPELLRSYGFIVPPGELPRRLLALPWRAVALFAGPWPWSLAGLALLALAALALLVLCRASRVPLTVAAALALAPIVPVSTDLSERYAAALWVVAVAAVGGAAAAGLRRGARWRRVTVAGLAALLTAFFVLSRVQWAATLAAAHRRDAESRALLELGDRDVLRRPIAMAAFLGELQRYRADVLRSPGAPVWFEDDLALCLGRFADRRLWQYDAAQGAVVDVTAERGALRRAACDGLHEAPPIAVAFETRAEGLYWNIDRVPAGARCALVFDDGGRAFEVPPRGGFRLPTPVPLRLRVRYDDPAGWTAYTPELALPGTVGARVVWPGGAP